jgi:aryl-alcohol dehydrogenase-like predicted oxidoreductase
MADQAGTGFAPRTLGRTGLAVGALGISASYGVPAAAVERAFEAGMNYVYWGTLRRAAFADALRALAPKRDRMVLVLQSYNPFASGIVRSVERGLRRLGFDHADVLLLGMWNRPVPDRIRAACRKLKERGLIRFVAASTHNRRVIATQAQDPDIDIFHVRYNAVHAGAERDVFPHLPQDRPPGIVAFTATSWKQLLDPRRVPKGERVPTAADCYRFVLSNPAVNLCMTGPGTSEHVDDAIKALSMGPMTAEELAWMRRVGQFIYGKTG